MWGKVFWLRKQHDGRDWASNHRPSDLKSNVLTHYTNVPPMGNIASRTGSFCLLGRRFLRNPTVKQVANDFQ